VITDHRPRSNGGSAPALGAHRRSPLGAHRGADAHEATIEVAPGAVLCGDLTLLDQPAGPRGLVLVAHASRLPRRDPRNRVVIAALSRAGLATLLLDLFTAHEKVGRPPAEDAELLSQRIVAATHWLREQPEAEALTVGCLGVSASSSAVLLAAARLPAHIGAVVCWGRGGEPAAAALRAIVAPVLLIVDGHAEDLEHCFALRERLQCPTEVAVVPGATHAFEHFGPVQRAARLTTDWFTSHLSVAAPIPQPTGRPLA